MVFFSDLLQLLKISTMEMLISDQMTDERKAWYHCFAQILLCKFSKGTCFGFAVLINTVWGAAHRVYPLSITCSLFNETRTLLLISNMTFESMISIISQEKCIRVLVRW